MAFDGDALRQALVTPQNARNVFSDLADYEIKTLCSEICSNSNIGQVKNATQEEIRKAFNIAGYDTVIFDDKAAILDCEKYYAEGERICTYNNLAGRMKQYHMLVAIKKNIDDIKRSQHPERDDEYGTSVLNIQIAKNGTHMSIKNRYNHTVSQPDSTLNNNLDNIYDGLQSMVLGYYGFASLKKSGGSYNYIVNINGVYLKYFRERDNIYYGAFVLDSEHGVRYADASRYYIVKTYNKYYSTYPIILDFKEKKAFDLDDGRYNNPRIPLLSRALKENALSSANKEEADYLKAVFANAKKELLQANKKALQYIHQYCGYDFTKPFEVTAVLGNFTANSLIKDTGHDEGLLLIGKNHYLCICEFIKGKFYAKNLSSDYKHHVDTFIRQKDFEELRKSPNTATYFIYQDKSYIQPLKQKETINYYHSRSKYDKSGCNLTESREMLYNRLEKYKTNKRKQEVDQIDFTSDIETIKKSFAELKTKTITLLANAETHDDYRTVRDVIDYHFIWLVDDIETIVTNAKNKTFKSIESADKLISSVKNNIKDYLKTIDDYNNKEE